MKKLITDLDIIDQNTEYQRDKLKNRRSASNKNSLRKLYIESYGCQIADVIFINTCSIRDKAEQTVRQRLSQFNALKSKRPEITIGVLGCMAERLKTRLLEEEKVVDLVAGPDAYRDIPNLLQEVEEGHKAVNTFLSREETYADINPVRLNSNGVTAFISIMRGCDNMCSFCVVPFTRGRERSRDPHSIVKEAADLFQKGFREVTLLGQNVDSYKWSPDDSLKGKAQIERYGSDNFVNFAQLLTMVAEVDPQLRVRFSTSHPKDITDEVVHTMKRYQNVCNYIHLPAQSGSTSVLKRMNRTYTREWYLDKISSIRKILGDDCGISSDMIAGFCGETEQDHQQTLSLMDEVRYDFSYMFYYSERPGALAAKKYIDDIDIDTKKRRLQEIIAKQQQHALERNKRDVNKLHRVLIEGYSKRSKDFLRGRNDANKVVVFPKESHTKGTYVNVLVTDCSAATLLGETVQS
jgi:tRNA-2-methylthio-N6-dimethylallyladenosine synthase